MILSRIIIREPGNNNGLGISATNLRISVDEVMSENSGARMARLLK